MGNQQSRSKNNNRVNPNDQLDQQCNEANNTPNPITSVIAETFLVDSSTNTDKTSTNDIESELKESQDTIEKLRQELVQVRKQLLIPTDTSSQVKLYEKRIQRLKQRIMNENMESVNKLFDKQQQLESANQQIDTLQKLLECKNKIITELSLKLSELLPIKHEELVGANKTADGDLASQQQVAPVG